MTDRNSGRAQPGSLPLNQWSDGDRQAWENACWPGSRLKSGGAASRLAQVTRDTIAWRYGLFLGVLQQGGRLNASAAAASQVTPSNVEAYITSLTARVRSVTLHGYVQGLHRAARLLAPSADFSWLVEIEKAQIGDGAEVEARPISAHDAARQSRFETHCRSAGVRKNGFRQSQTSPQWPDDRGSGIWPNSPEEFRRLGNRRHFQGGWRALVDLPASGRYQIAAAR